MRVKKKQTVVHLAADEIRSRLNLPRSQIILFIDLILIIYFTEIASYKAKIIGKKISGYSVSSRNEYSIGSGPILSLQQGLSREN